MVIYQRVLEHQPEKQCMTIQVLACAMGNKKKNKLIKWISSYQNVLHLSSKLALELTCQCYCFSEEEAWVLFDRNSIHPSPRSSKNAAQWLSPADVNLSSALHTHLTTTCFPSPVYSIFALNSRSGACPSSARMLGFSPAAKIISSQSFQTLKLKFYFPSHL